jgi:peptidoglycan/LPS O-acetylase OafA/YrhL
MPQEPDFRVNNFDLLRIFAATQVLLLHSFEHLSIPFPGWFKVVSKFEGVPMFFVMSGFLISASLERNTDLKNYFKNRFLRIYPALIFVVILSVIVISATSNINFVTLQGLKWFVLQCFGFIYTPEFLLHYGFGSYNGSLWTIPIELQFYVILPILYYIVIRITKIELTKTRLIFAAFLLFTIIAYIVALRYSQSDPLLETKGQKILRYSFIPQVFMFFLGVFLQRIKAYRSGLIYQKGFYWAIVYLIYSYLMPPQAIFPIVQHLLLGLTSISLAYTLPKLSEKILRGNDISYGVYIYHGLILAVLVQLHYTGQIYEIFIVLVGAYLIAIFSWNFVEKPFMRRKKKTIHAVAE